MSLTNYIFKRKVKELAEKVMNGEEVIDNAVDKFLSDINWGRLLGLMVRKAVGLLK